MTDLKPSLGMAGGTEIVHSAQRLWKDSRAVFRNLEGSHIEKRLNTVCQMSTVSQGFLSLECRD